MSVSHLTQLGIVNGITETTFSPNKEVTRAEFAKMLSLMAGANLSASHGVTPFNDVETNAWYAPAAQWASDRGIVMGRSEDQFCPEDSITREEAAVMLYRLAETENSDLLTGSTFYGQSQFQDAEEISDWAQNQVEKMQGIGILQGDNDRFRPQDKILRSKAASILSVYLIYDQKPTLIVKTGFMSYKKEISSFTQEASNQLGEDVLSIFDKGDFRWKSKGNIPESTHKDLTHQGFSILFHDRGESIRNLMDEYSVEVQAIVENGSVAPDRDEKDHKSAGHYCSPSLTNKFHKFSPTAYTRLNNHYYKAVIHYYWGNFKTAYDELGRAIHYLEDINCPPHAGLITGIPHAQYEAWVRDYMRSDYYIFTAPKSTYHFMSHASLKTVSQNFASLTERVATACVYEHSTSLTRECLSRAQRAVAGLLYRYLMDTGRVN